MTKKFIHHYEYCVLPFKVELFIPGSARCFRYKKNNFHTIKQCLFTLFNFP